MAPNGHKQTPPIDELIAQNPEFRASIERARRQKASGQTKTLAQLREKCASDVRHGSGESSR